MVEWKHLGDIMQIVRGSSPRPIQNYLTNSRDGVNWIKIGDVLPDDKYITQTKEKITLEGARKSRFLHKGDFILSNSMSFGRPYILEIDGCIHDGWIAMSGFEKYISSGYLYEILNTKYVQNYWKTKANNGGAMTNLNSDIVRSTTIPIPSFKEQKHIVGILDTFNASINNLTEQIAQRQKQYEYYRNKLLSFEEGDTEYIKLGKLCQIRNGYTPSKTNLEYWTNGTIPWFRLEDIRQNGRILSDAIQHITGIAVKKGGPFKENSVIVSTTATIGEHAIITVPFVCNQQITILTPFEGSVLPKYLYYCGYLIGEWCKNNVNGAGLAIIPSNKLTECEIPVPSFDKQLSIVRTLDTFESLLTNLKKERELRQKQYEYYREKLLTFA